MPQSVQRRTILEELIELRYGQPVSEILRDRYVRQGMSQQRIAEELGIDRKTVMFWLARHNIGGTA